MLSAWERNPQCPHGQSLVSGFSIRNVNQMASPWFFPRGSTNCQCCVSLFFIYLEVANLITPEKENGNLSPGVSELLTVYSCLKKSKACHLNRAINYSVRGATGWDQSPPSCGKRLAARSGFTATYFMRLQNDNASNGQGDSTLGTALCACVGRGEWQLLENTLYNGTDLTDNTEILLALKCFRM